MRITKAQAKLLSDADIARLIPETGKQAADAHSSNHTLKRERERRVKNRQKAEKAAQKVEANG